MVTVVFVGIGVGVAPAGRVGGTPTNTGKLTEVSWPVIDEIAYAAKSTPRFRLDTLTLVVKARGSVPAAPGTALPRKLPPVSRWPRNRSTLAIPESWVAAG